MGDSYLMLIFYLSVSSASRRLDYSIPSCSLATSSVIALSQLIDHQHLVSITSCHCNTKYWLILPPCSELLSFKTLLCPGSKTFLSLYNHFHCHHVTRRMFHVKYWVVLGDDENILKILTLSQIIITKSLSS